MLARRVSDWHREPVKPCHVNGAVCWSRKVELLCMTTFALQHLLRETWRTAVFRPPNTCNLLTDSLAGKPLEALSPGLMTRLAGAIRPARPDHSRQNLDSSGANYPG